MANLYDYPGWGTTVTIARNPSPTGSGGPEGRESEIPFLITPLSALGPFLTFCRGEIETVPIAGGGTIERRMPLVHPDDPEQFLFSYTYDYLGTPMSELWAVGKSVHTEQFSHVVLRAVFRTPPVGIGPGQQFYSISRDTGASVETIPGGAMRTVTGRPLTGDRGLVIPVTSLVITTFYGATPVGYAIDQIVGCVNSVDFISYVGNYPAGMLRFDKVSEQRNVGSAGVESTKQFALSYRRQPWNRVMNDLGVWEDAESVSGGLPKYESADLNILKSS